MDFNQEPTGPSSPSVRNAHRPAQNALGAMAGRQGPDICDHKESGLPNQDLYAKDDDDPKKLLIKLTANMARREDLNQKSIEPLTSSIQVLFQTAQVCFDAIPARRGSEAAKARSRLEQWREKAFDSAGSLDIVFESSKLACQPLRQCVLIILVRMLVWGGLELGGGPMSTSDFDKSAYSSLYQTAVSRTDKLLMPSLPESTRVDLPGVSKIRSPTADPIPIHGLVEALHYLLPALIATRRFEEASVPNVEETGGEYLKYNEHYFADAQEGFRDAEEILKKLDKHIGKKGAPGYALRLNLEKERLDVVDTLCKSRKDMITKTLWNIQDKQVDLEAELAAFRSSAVNIARHKIIKFVGKLRFKDHGKDDAEILISIMHQRNRDLEDLLHKQDVQDERKALESNSGNPDAQ